MIGRFSSVAALFLVVFGFSLSVAFAHGEASPSVFGLTEGDLLRVASLNDPDIYIVNASGFKRLILSPAIFSYYGHFQWRQVKSVEVGVRDAFPTSALVRNCEANDPKVYAVEVAQDDAAVLHWVDLAADAALVQDDDFFKKVFCINAREFAMYARGDSYDAVSRITAYERTKLPPPSVNETSLPLILPDGFRIRVFAQNLGPVRFMAIASDGVLFASMPASTGLYGSGSRTDGKVYALPDLDSNGVVDEVKTVLSGLRLPHGLAFYGGYLYVAEEGTISRYRYLGNAVVGSREVIVADLPQSDDGHVSRTIGFRSSGKMYVSVGSSCNSCEETDDRRAAILEYNPDGSGGRVFARGLRNSVGFVFHPTAGEIWATDNGRDYLGEDLPPDEVNIVLNGGHYGWPYCYGKNVVDPAFSRSDICRTAQASTYNMQAHSAALGLRFITSAQFPAGWQGDLLVAYHGSWNRRVPTGYSVARLDVDNGVIVGEENFISGWLRPDGSKLGRPVDVIFGSDGALYVSDDKANVIYRISKL